MRLPNGYGSVYVENRAGRRRRYRAILPAVYEVVKAPDGSEVLDDHGLVQYRAVRRSLGAFGSRKEALAALANYHARGSKAPAQAVTLADLFAAWSAFKFANCSGAAQAAFLLAFRKLEPLHARLVASLDMSEAQALIDAAGGSYASKYQIKNLLVQLFDYAVSLGYVASNPYRYLDVGRQRVRILRRLFTSEEVSELWSLAGDPYADFALLLLYTGMRRHELFSLSEVHLEASYVVGGSKTAAGRGRVIPLHAAIVPVFVRLRAFLAADPRRPRSFAQAAARWLQDAFGHRPHDARYSFVSRLGELGVPLVVIQRIVGHRSGSVTVDVYTKIETQELVQAVSVLDYGVQTACKK